jgi:uncharacterized protein
MKLQLEEAAGRCVFTGYGKGYVAVNHRRFETPVLVMPESILPWEVSAFPALAPEHFAGLLVHRPEIVLLGTGATLRFPAPSLTHALAAAAVGLEVMDTHAACRTFNILTSEGRRVLAAIFVE